MELAASGLAARQSRVENTASADGLQSALPCPFVVVVVRGCGVGLPYAHPPRRPFLSSSAKARADRSSAHALPMRLAAPEP